MKRWPGVGVPLPNPLAVAESPRIPSSAGVHPVKSSHSLSIPVLFSCFYFYFFIGFGFCFLLLMDPVVVVFLFYCYLLFISVLMKCFIINFYGNHEGRSNQCGSSLSLIAEILVQNMV